MMNKHISYNNVFYHNHIKDTKYPFFLSLFLVFFFIFLVLFFNKYDVFSYFFVSFIFFFLNIFYWAEKDLFFEADSGIYNLKLYNSILVGFFVFLFSEVGLFSGFLWCFFDRALSLSPLEFSFYFSNISIERVVWIELPFLVTLIFIFSGYCAVISYYYYSIGEKDLSNGFLQLSIISGLFFLICQVKEYNELSFCFDDNVISSIFFLLTSFHAMHAIVGLFLLNISLVLSEK